MKGFWRFRPGKTRGTELPPDLRGLDRDLRTIAIEERCSFGAELRAGLTEEQRRIQAAGPIRRAWTGLPVAAGAVLLLAIGAVAAPAARASLAKWFASVRSPETETPSLPTPSPAAPTHASTVHAGPELDPVRPALLPATIDDAPARWVAPRATLPGLLDPEQAREAVAREYPRRLQSDGVGGMVRVLAWVQPGGDASQARVAESSGAEGLDSAALRATRSFRFRPATHNGRPVGTWVEFSIRFRPYAPDARLGPDYQAFHIPLSN